MMFVNARCNNAGPLGKPIPTRSFAAFLFARFNTPDHQAPMVKTSNPWLRGLLRAGKKQQRSVVRVLGSLLAPPKPNRAKRQGAAKPRLRRLLARPPIAPLKPSSARPAPAAAARHAQHRRAGAGARAGRAGHRQMARLPSIPAFPTARHLAPHELLAVPARPASRRDRAGAGLPLIVMLHGCDQTATLFAQGTRMNQLAEAAGYAVLYPQQAVSTHPHRCWKWYDRATQQGGGDVPMIVGIINKVIASYPIDRSRIYICGISAGAGMANIVALNHPELFAGLGLHSGPIFGAGHSTIGALAVMQHGAGMRVDGAIAEVLDRRPSFSAAADHPDPGRGRPCGAADQPGPAGAPGDAGQPAAGRQPGAGGGQGRQQARPRLPAARRLPRPQGDAAGRAHRRTEACVERRRRAPVVQFRARARTPAR